MSFCDNDKVITFLNETYFFSVLTLQSMERLYGVVQKFALSIFLIMPSFFYEDDTTGVTWALPPENL